MKSRVDKDKSYPTKSRKMNEIILSWIQRSPWRSDTIINVAETSGIVTKNKKTIFDVVLKNHDRDRGEYIEFLIVSWVRNVLNL